MSTSSKLAAAVLLLSLFVGGVAASGCEEKKTDTTSPDATGGAVTGAAATGSGATAVNAAAGEDTEEDFEDEAASSITEDNLEAELAKLEAEIK